MVTALANRGIETHVIDHRPWALSDVADPEIAQPVEDSWTEMGVKMHYGVTLEAFVGDRKISAVRTSAAELPADLAVVCTKKVPNTALGAAAGLKTGPTGGFVVDNRMSTSAEGVFAAGDCVEVPLGVGDVPVQGLSGSHAYAQGKVAGINAGGGRREYQPVFVPWGMVAGHWMIGGAAYGETTAKALGIPYVMGVAQGISRARYYPGVKTVKVKLLAEPNTLRLIGAQMVGQEGIKERADFLAMAVKTGITLEDLAYMENVYSPPIGALNEPIALAAQNALANLS
jgi:NADH oxidase (H2O2-forming)